MVLIRIAIFINLLVLGNNLLAQNQTPYLISPSGDSFFDFFVSKSDKLYFSDSNKLWIYDIEQKKTIKELVVNLDSPVTSIVADEEQQIVFLGTKSGNIGGFDLESGHMRRFFFHKENRITSMVIDPDNKFLLVGVKDGDLFRHSIEDLNAYETIVRSQGEVTSLKMNQDKSAVAVSWSEGRIVILNPVTGEQESSTRVKGQYVRDLAFAGDKNRILSVSDEGYLCKWKISKKDHLALLDKEKVSGNWLLTVDVNDSGLSFCYGGTDHSFVFESPYGKNKIKFNGPVLKAHLLESHLYVSFITCIYGKGIYFTDLKDMRSVSQR